MCLFDISALTWPKQNSSFSTPTYPHPTASPALCPSQEMESQLSWLLRLLLLSSPIYPIHLLNMFQIQALLSIFPWPPPTSKLPSSPPLRWDQKTMKSHWFYPRRDFNWQRVWFSPVVSQQRKLWTTEDKGLTHGITPKGTARLPALSSWGFSTANILDNSREPGRKKVGS